MSQNNRPSSHGPDVPPPAPIPEPPLPLFDGSGSEAMRQGTIDFNAYTQPAQGGSGGLGQVPISDPTSGGSVVSWAELLRQQSPGSDDEVALGSLPELQIDSISDNEIIKHLERETGQSGVLNQQRGNSSKKLKAAANAQAGKDAKADGTSPSGKNLKALAASVTSKTLQKQQPLPEQMPTVAKAFTPPTQLDDWLRDVVAGDGSSVDLMQVARELRAKDNTPAPKADESDVLLSAMHPDDGTSAVNLGAEPRPSLLLSKVSWGQPPARPQALRSPKALSRPVVNLRHPQRLTTWLGGAVAGVATTAAVGIGLWVGGVFPPVRVQTVTVAVPADPVPVAAVEEKPTPERARRLLEGGEPERALEVFSRCDASPAVLAGRGQARWLLYVRTQKRGRAALAERDAEVTQARKDLIASKSAEGTLWLGLICEAFGQFTAAREAYDLGHDNFAERTRLFVAARSRLDILTKSGGAKVSVRLDPQLGLALALIMTELPAGAGGIGDEAGYDFWEAVTLAHKGDFAAGRAALLKSRAAHERRRDLTARRGPNPDSDPREEIFLCSCDQMLAYWNVRAKLHEAGFEADGRSPAEVIDTLLAGQKKYDVALKSLATTLNTDKPEELAAALDALMKQRQRAEDNWKRAEDAFRRADQSLKSAQGDLAKKSEELAALRKAADDDLKRAFDREAAGRRALGEVTVARKSAEESLEAIRARLAKAKLIEESAGPADIARALDSLLSAGADAKDSEIARLRTLLEQARKTPVVAEPAAAKPDAVLAEKYFSEGLRLYHLRRFAEAEQYLDAAWRNNDRDARILYFLGLSRLALDKADAAEDAVRRAADLERQGLPDASEISLLFERVQGPERQLINRFRR